MSRHRTRANVNLVRTKFPPGSLLRHVDNNLSVYMIGVKFGLSEFWMMRYDPPKRFKMHANEIVANYDLADSQVREMPAPRAFQYTPKEAA